MAVVLYMKNKYRIIIFCKICGKPWTGGKKEDRCWCDVSGVGEQRLVETKEVLEK